MRLPTPKPPDLAPLKQRDAVVDGVRIAYTEAGSGPPVLLLHGAVFCGNPFGWDLQAALAPDFLTVAPDYPGWGASEKPQGLYDLDRYVRFFNGFLDALGLERVAVVGHSLGGVLGSAFALMHPERVVSLTTIAVPPCWVEFGVPPLFQPFLVPVLGETLLAVSPIVGAGNPLGIRRYYESLFHAPRQISPQRLNQVLEACLEVTGDPLHQRAFLGTMREAHAIAKGPMRHRFRAMAADAPFPMMMIGGRQDPMFPFPLIEDGAGAVPGARLHLLDACGHFPTWEQPEQVASLVHGFLHAGAVRL